MVNNLKSPFFFIDGDDVGVFATLEELQSFLEPWAVREGDLFTTDADGHRLEFRIVKAEKPVLFGLFKMQVERVEFDKPKAAADCREELRAALVKFLLSQGFPEDVIRHDSLEILADKALAKGKS